MIPLVFEMDSSRAEPFMKMNPVTGVLIETCHDHESENNVFFIPVYKIKRSLKTENNVTRRSVEGDCPVKQLLCFIEKSV